MRNFKRLLILTLLIAGNAFALQLESGWNYKFEKEVFLKCTEDEYICDDFCENKKHCRIKEKICRDCVGSSIYMTHFFNNLGKSIVSSGVEIPVEELLAMLENGAFATITAKSVYNHIDFFNGSKIQEKFSFLCQGYNVESPLVFLETNPVSKMPIGAKYLVCGENIFSMDNFGGVSLHK